MSLKALFNGTPRIAVSFRDNVSASEIRKVKKAGADIAELRIDLFSSCEKKYVLKEIQKFTGWPVLATIRSKHEGGSWRLSEKERLDLFKTVIPKIDGVDIELSSSAILKDVIRKARQEQKLVLVSYHNFSKTPSLGKLNRLVKKAKAAGADIVKIACVARNTKDIHKLAQLTISRPAGKLITIAMGHKGVISRVFFPALGSPLTYTYWKRSSAPGQLDYETTVKLFRIFYPQSRLRK